MIFKICIPIIWIFKILTVLLGRNAFEHLNQLLVEPGRLDNESRLRYHRTGTRNRPTENGCYLARCPTVGHRGRGVFNVRLRLRTSIVENGFHFTASGCISRPVRYGLLEVGGIVSGVSIKGT